MRPRWFFWAVYALTVPSLFVFGAALGLVAGVNPYLPGLTACGGGVLRIAYQTGRGNFYKRWWAH